VRAPTGTGATIALLLQDVGAAGMPLKLILFDPCETPNPLPLTVTDVPTGPTEGEMPVIAGTTVKELQLVLCPATVTTIGPVEAFAGTGTVMLVSAQLDGVPVTPLKVTVLDP